MNSIFINSKNSRTSESYRLLLNLADKLDLKKSNKFVLRYTQKNMKKSYNKNKSKISVSTWNENLRYPKDVCYIKYSRLFLMNLKKSVQKRMIIL